MVLQLPRRLTILAYLAAVCAARCLAQATDPLPSGTTATALSSDSRAADPANSACISGAVVDPSGAVIPGADVKVTRDGQAITQDAISGTNGQFFIANLAPGTFDLTVTAPGFSKATYSGVLHAKEIDTVPAIVLAVPSSLTEVSVGLSREEIAEEEIKVEEKQRVLGIIPNFYVTYNPHAVPLTPRQKFKLATRTVVDPFTFLSVAGAAGIEQWQDHFVTYGQGMQGYEKRFGANYADTVSGTFIGGAILPALLKQDPRYFYKGIGTVQSRFLYAIAMSFICKGDNGRWQPNYSGILGSLAAGGISNIYYPPADRSGVGLTFDNAAIGIASNAFGNLLQEFVIPKLTPHLHRNAAGNQLSQ